MTAHVQTPSKWAPKALVMRATMRVLDHFKVRYITIYVDRRDKPAWTAQIGWL